MFLRPPGPGWLVVYVAMRLTLVPEPRAVDNSRDACRSPFTTHSARLTFIFSPVHIRYAPPRVCPGFVWNMCFCHTHTKRRINVAMATRDTYWQYNAILAGTRVKGSFFLSLLSVNINLKDCTHTHTLHFLRAAHFCCRRTSMREGKKRLPDAINVNMSSELITELYTVRKIITTLPIRGGVMMQLRKHAIALRSSLHLVMFYLFLFLFVLP